MKIYPLYFLSLFIIVLFASSSSANTDKQNLALMPLPNGHVEMGEGKFRITDSFKMAIQGNPDKRIYPEATRMLRRLAGRTGIFLPQGFITEEQNVESPSLRVTVDRPGQLHIREDESYTLEVTAESIILTAKTDMGALHGFETLLQLIDVDDEGYYIPSIQIQDEPRFTWRGLMIDSGRHFMPVDVIKRNLDGMAAVKLNVFHWHLTEDQGFRIESKKFPKLHEQGSDGDFYTQEEIKDIIAYADQRGIRVVPEFDIPGHATSWLVGHPELASIPDSYEIIRSFGIKEPTLDPTSETVYDFLDTFLGEMAGLFPDDYLHIGGDEVTGTDWDESSDIQAYMAENNIPDNEALQAYFNRRVMDILQDNGKTMVGWEEILHPDLPKSIVIQSWYGRQSMIDAAREGYQSLLSNGYYIDLSQPTDLHYVNNPLPPGSPLTEEEKQFIMGGEATMWSEFVTPENIDSRIWPRMAAIAEVFWSTDVPTIDLPSGRELFIPDDLLTPEITQAIDDMYRRLEVVSFRLEELGLTHEKNYDMMIRRLANNKDTQPVKTLVDVIEPVKIYNRGSQREYTSYSPMTRAVDAARPDARVAREFRKLVADFIYSGGSDATIGQEIQQRLTLWEGNHEVFVESVSYSPVLEEIETLSKDLALISTTGMEALSFIQASEKASEQWAKNALELTSASMEPRGQVELRVISAVEKMIKFAAE